MTVLVCFNKTMSLKPISRPATDDLLLRFASVVGTEHVIADFSYGGMPHEDGELNMRLFADRVVPVLHRDGLFASPAVQSSTAAHEDMFAPA